MKKTVLIDIIPIGENGIHLSWLLKFHYLSLLGYELTIYGGTFLQKINFLLDDPYLFNQRFEKLQSLPQIPESKLGFMLYCLWKNVLTLTTVKEVFRRKFDLLYSPAATLDLLIFPYFFKLFYPKIKWTVVFDGPPVNLFRPGLLFVNFLAWIFYRVSFFFIQKADVVFAISKEMRQELINKGVLLEKIIVTSNGIEDFFIAKASSQKGLKTDALFIGRINFAKGINDLITVVKIVKRKFPGFLLGIMGQGDPATEDVFKKSLKQNSLENNVRLLGFRTGKEKFDFIKSTKCFLFLSYEESFGLALLEAVSCGKPAIVYNLPCYREIYRHEEIITVPVGDTVAAATKLIDLLKTKNFSNPRGKLLRGKYSWQKVAKMENRVLKKL